MHISASFPRGDNPHEAELLHDTTDEVLYSIGKELGLLLLVGLLGQGGLLLLHQLPLRDPHDPSIHARAAARNLLGLGRRLLGLLGVS